MAYFNEFPHTRNYDADLGWLIRNVKKLQQKFDRCPTWYGEWVPEIEYPALAFVQYGNVGDTYMAIKPVPSNTPITDEGYWIKTGSTSEQILDLQRRMSAAEEEIVAVNARVDSIGTRNILSVSDSYGQYRNDSDRSFADVAAHVSGYDVRLVALGSAGFGSVIKFLTALQSFDGNRNEITDIVVVGGANDIAASVTESAIISGINEFRNYAKANFQNLKKIYLFACGVSYNSGFSVENRSKMVNTYKMAALSFSDVVFCDNAQYILFNRYYVSDNVHPTPRGVDQIGGYLGKYLKGGAINVYNKITYSCNPVSGITMLPGMSAGSSVQINENVKCHGTGFQPFLGFSFDVPVGVNAEGLTTLHTICAMDNAPIDQQDDGNNLYVQMPCILGYSDNTRSVGRVTFKIVAGAVYAQMQTAEIKAIKSVTPMGAFETIAEY